MGAFGNVVEVNQDTGVLRSLVKLCRKNSMQIPAFYAQNQKAYNCNFTFAGIKIDQPHIILKFLLQNKLRGNLIKVYISEVSDF